MANALYAAMKQRLLGEADIGTTHPMPDFEGGDQRVILVDAADYTVNLSTNQDLADVIAGARVATAQLATEALTTAGTPPVITWDADDTTFTSVTGDVAENLVIYNHDATEANALLLVFFDTFSSGMPVTPNGGNIIIQWNASGIFSW